MLTQQEFLGKIRTKYPQYKNIEDNVLFDKIITKYPQYKEQIQIEQPKQEKGGFSNTVGNIFTSLANVGSSAMEAGAEAGEAIGAGFQKAGADVGELVTGYRAKSAPKEKGIIGRTGETVSGVGESIKEAKTAEVAGQQSFARSMAQSMGFIGGGISETIGDAFMSTLQTLAPKELEDSVKAGVEDISKTKGGEYAKEQVQKALESYEYLKESDPKKARDYKAIFGALEFTADALGFASVKKAVTQTGKDIVTPDAPKNIFNDAPEIPTSKIETIDPTIPKVDTNEQVTNFIEKGIEDFKKTYKGVEERIGKGSEEFIGKPGQEPIIRKITSDDMLKMKEAELNKLPSETIAKKIEESGKQQKAASLSTKANRFNSKDIEDFKTISGETPGEFAVNRGMTKVGDEAVDEAVILYKKSMDEADIALSEIAGDYKMVGYKVDYMAKMLDDLETRLINTLGEGADRVTALKKKYITDGLTMSEINEMKRLYSQNFKYNFLEAAGEAATTSKNIQDRVRKWQFKVADEQGFTNLKEINKTTQSWKAFADSLDKKIQRSSGNHNVSLTDYVSLAGGNPSNVALFAGKKILGTNYVKSKVIGKLGTQTKPNIIKASKKGIESKNKAKMFATPPKKKKIILKKIETKKAPNKKVILKGNSKGTLPKKKKLALPEGKRVTPQTKDKAIIQESKKDLKYIDNKSGFIDPEAIIKDIAGLAKKTIVVQDKIIKGIVKGLGLVGEQAKKATKIFKDFLKQWGSELGDKLEEVFDKIAVATGAKMKFMDDTGKSLDDFGTTKSVGLVEEAKKYKSADEFQNKIITEINNVLPNNLQAKDINIAGSTVRGKINPNDIDVVVDVFDKNTGKKINSMFEFGKPTDPAKKALDIKQALEKVLSDNFSGGKIPAEALLYGVQKEYPTLTLKQYWTQYT